MCQGINLLLVDILTAIHTGSHVMCTHRQQQRQPNRQLISPLQEFLHHAGHFRSQVLAL